MTNSKKNVATHGFLYNHPAERKVTVIQSKCPICENSLEFSSNEDFWSCRDQLAAEACPLGRCVVRERALAEVLFTLFDREQVMKLSIHEPAPTPRGLSLWLSNHALNYIKSGYFPNNSWGSNVNGIRNENLEAQTFPDFSFDLVIHLDVLEHLFDPFRALNEVYRTLKPGGFCLFSAPTEHNRFHSEQVAQITEAGKIVTVGKPEYHGNPQRESEGALVTWRYGYDLPLLIARHTPFDVEVRRWQTRSRAIMGYMTEIYILKKGC